MLDKKPSRCALLALPHTWLLGACVWALVIDACSDRTLEVAQDPPSAIVKEVADSGVDGQMLASDCPAAGCACNDGIDNDEDGLVDGLDPECTGPFDADEASFDTGQRSANTGPCVDCFFDGNPTAADDTCRYERACGDMPGQAQGIPACDGCTVNAACVNSCRPRTPNGCDCFGCCEVYDKGKKPKLVWLVAGCSLANIDDPKACPHCKQSEDCRNECGTCELCIGKTPEDLGKDCAVDGGVPDYACSDGPVCGKKQECKAGFYCQQGCCIPVLQ